MRKRLAKSKKRWVLGVAGGLGEYFGIHPALFRAAFVVATLFSILGLVAYFILAVWMPKAPEGDV